MKLRAIALITTLALGLLTAPVPVEAQQAGKVYRIGYLSTTPPTSARGALHIWEAFLQGLRELGYVEGQNIVIEGRFSEGKVERFSGLAAELVHLKVDIIVAGGGVASLAAKQATTTIPIAMIAADPVAAGLVASLARPGGNITGVTHLPAEWGKWLEFLKEAAPGLSRVAVLSNPANPIDTHVWSGMQGAAPKLGVTLQRHAVREAEDLERAFAAMSRERADALFVPPYALFAIHGKQIVDLAVRNQLPAMYGFRQQVEAGGLMAYAPSFADLFRRLATYVDKILKGTRPADLPVEQPTRFGLFINMKTAKALGLTIPDTLLIRADRVIK